MAGAIFELLIQRGWTPLDPIRPRGFAGEWLLLDDVRRLGAFRALRGLELD